MLEVSFSNRYKDYILYHSLICSPKWQKKNKTLELSWSMDYSVKTRDEEIKLLLFWTFINHCI